MTTPESVAAWVAAISPVLTPIMTAVLGLFIVWGNNKLTKIHAAVNSTYGTALEIGATALQRIADITKDPADREKAKAARKLADDHALASPPLPLDRVN